MINNAPLFTSDMGKFTDFTQVSAADIFNRSVIPAFESLEALTQKAAQVTQEPTVDYNAPLTDY